MHDPDIRQVPGQMTQAFRHFSNLVQGELKLARAEMSRNMSRAGTALAFLGIAALLALVALNVLAMALVELIAASGFPESSAAGLVGGALLLGAVALAFVGRTRLKAKNLAPKRTIAGVERDIENIKEALNV